MNPSPDSPSTSTPRRVVIWHRPGLIALYVAFLGMLILITLALAEFVVLPARYAPVPRSIQLCGFHAPPRMLIDDTRINDLGFTGDNIKPRKAAGTIRILTLGGSTFFNRRMTERLGARLRESTRQPVELLGAALRGHTTVSSVYKYAVLAKYDFDCVIIYHGINDLFANNVPPERFSPDYSQIDPWYRRGPLLDRSLLARIKHNGSRMENKIRTAFPLPHVENASRFASVAVFEESLRMLIESTRAHGSTPVLLTFASAFPDNYSFEAFEEFKLGYNNPDRYDPSPSETWGSPAYVKEGLRRHNAVTRRLAAEYDVPLLDQELLMGSDLHWFSDVCHFSEPGTDRFIGFLVDFLIKEKLLR